MTRSVRITVMTILVVLLGVATMLATLSGAISAIDWASRTFGSIVVYIVAAFLAGCIVTHSVHRGVAAGAGAGCRERRRADGRWSALNGGR